MNHSILILEVNMKWFPVVYCLCLFNMTQLYESYFCYFSQERLDDIEKHQCEYTFEEDDRRIQDVLLKPESIKNDASILKKTLSRSYPNLGLHDALQKENEKLQLELQISQSNMDVGQCQIIERLFDITEALSANYFMEKDLQKGIPTQHEYNYSDANSEIVRAYDESFHKNRDASMAR